MRYRLMATYRGVPYEAGVGPTDADVVLFAACPPPEELGFEPATGHWRKELRIEEVQALWESRPMGVFRGDRCIVLDDLGDRLHIAYLGHDAYQAEQLGYWQVDRGVFELITPRDEVSEIVEERLDYPQRPGGKRPRAASPRAAAAPATAPQPAVPPATAPQAAGLPGTAPPVTAPPATAPQPAVPPAAAPLSAGPGMAGGGAARDLAVIPPGGEPPLPLEAAARRAASARVLQSAGPAGPPAPESGPLTPDAGPLAAEPRPLVPDPGPLVPEPRPLVPEPGPLVPEPGPLVPEPGPRAPELGIPAQQLASTAPQPVPPAAAPSPRGPQNEPPPPRRRRSALRRQATQRIFSELAGLAAIPPSAYAVGEEVDGAMCLIQTPDGFEVFNAAAGARHEVRIFDDEESAYFYLFGVLAAEAVRTGRLAPQG